MSILDAKYEKANIDATINTLKHLSSNQQHEVESLALQTKAFVFFHSR
jgi:hypothetical protein